VLFLQISRLSESLAACPRLKVLRIEENCLPLAAFTPRILRESPVSLLAIDGNVFDMKSFQELDGYDQVSLVLSRCTVCDFSSDMHFWSVFQIFICVQSYIERCEIEKSIAFIENCYW